MARSPLTLAASVSSALPRVGVVGVGSLTTGAAGRFDSALAALDDGRRVVVRAATTEETAAELAAEVRALRALTAGVRALLPFRVPEVLGEAGIGGARAVVFDYLPGYGVDAAHLPAGRGAATSVGEALAAVHGLPVSVLRAEGLPQRSAQQVRDELARLVDRAEATRRLPDGLAERWRAALGSDALWRFESAVVLGGAGASAFLYEDIEGAPTVVGLLEWHDLSTGDPAVDLHWLASAPEASADVYDAYTRASGRAPDGLLRERARLHAELEFAKWLVHGHDVGSAEIVDDAVGLLTALASAVAGRDLVADAALSVDDAIALLGRVPEAATEVDTSMQTDAYDPEELGAWLADERADETESDPAAPVAAEGAEPTAPVLFAGADVLFDDPAPAAASAGTPTGEAWKDLAFAPDDTSTAPIDLPLADPEPPLAATQPHPIAGLPETNLDEDLSGEAERATDAALRRWLAD